MDREDIALALALFVGIALTGQVAGLVRSAGFEGLGTLVWPVGYGSIVLAAWLVWIRPMDLDARDPDDPDIWGPDEEQTEPDR
ncbi:hypothetical protein C475_08731 [Halosimplex carlsbadense 2-9-1]|uniref:Uncharacterized protein n=1 Tax=Halosimplex carlsbadense 2-9-1 TaxID=797114 RepID=M0CX63_9EURY|nr:hypothetical protein [Halosimplex carlsbadense]ELZ27007.1 hypothetical protein C475_08731 [Halosimplex carlsbadense 2-9-1]